MIGEEACFAVPMVVDLVVGVRLISFAASVRRRAVRACLMILVVGIYAAYTCAGAG